MTEQPDYSHPTDVFRLAFPMLTFCFAFSAAYAWSEQATGLAVALTIPGSVVAVSSVVALLLPRQREAAVQGVSQSLRELGASRVLDVRCGKGFLTLQLAAEGLAVVGEDFDEDALEAARENARVEGLEAEFVLGEEAQPNVPAESFDAVTSLQLLHELEPDQRSTLLASCRDAVRPGGHLVMVDFRRGPALYALMFLGARKALGGPKLEQLFAEAGFEDLRVEAITPLHQLITARRSG